MDRPQLGTGRGGRRVRLGDLTTLRSERGEAVAQSQRFRAGERGAEQGRVGAVGADGEDLPPRGGGIDAEHGAAQAVVPDGESFPAERGQDQQARRAATAPLFTVLKQVVCACCARAAEIGDPCPSGPTPAPRAPTATRTSTNSLTKFHIRIESLGVTL